MTPKSLVTASVAIFLFSGLLYSQQNNPMTLNEAFIMITVTSARGNSFYRVMTDSNDNPYLNITDFMEKYLDLTSVSCDAGEKYCQGTMQPNKNIFWLDGKQSQYGDAEQGSGIEKIPEGAFVIQEGSCWLRYDIWEKWLPLTATWDYRSYYLSVIPEFKLLSERKKQRDQEIEYSNSAKAEKEAIDSSDAIKPDDTFRPELKYHTSLRKYPQQDIGGDFNYDGNIDVFNGSFQFGGPVTYDKGPGWDAGRPYKVFRLRDQGWFYLMEAGDTYFEESNMLLPNISGNNGFRFDSREMVYGAGSIVVNGRAQQNTVVDLYRDGLYLDTVRTGTDGRYEFNDVVVSSSSRLIAKLYYPDGSEEEREIVLSDDNGMIIPKGEFQERVFTGETPYGRMNYMALRYGLFNNVTIGVHPMFFTGSEHASVMTDLAMRPLPDTVFLGQGLFTGKNFDRAFKVNTTLLYPNFFEVEHRYYSGNTPSFFKNVRVLGEYWAGRHSLSMGRLQFINMYEQYTGLRDASMEVIYTFNRFLKPFFSFAYYFPKGTAGYRLMKAGFDVMPTDHSVLEVARTWTPPVPINSISFFVRNIINVGGWDIGATWNIPDRLIKSNITADVMYRITKNLSLGVISNDKYFGFRINWDGIIAPTPGPDTWSDFAMGTISGKVMSPKTEQGEPYPIEGANIIIGSKIATTDKEGNYSVSSIAPYQKLITKIDPVTLDATVGPEKEFDVLYFRPGTQITWNPKLLWTAGMDGIIEGLEEVTPGMLVEAIKLPGQKVAAKGRVEDDGFFIIEKLTPGKYELKLKGLKDDNTKTTEIEIPETTNWLSGVKWNIGSHRITKSVVEKTEEPAIVKTKVKTKTKIKTKKTLFDNNRYYAIDNGPLFITKVKEEAKANGYKGLDGSISSNKRVPTGLIVEAIGEDGTVASQTEIMRDGVFILEELGVGKYELRLVGAQNPPPPMKIEIDDDVDWLSGIVWTWEQ